MTIQVYISTAIPEPDGGDWPRTVGNSASILASQLVADILTPALQIDAEGSIIIPKWALFRMAVEIERFVERGGVLLEEMLPP